MARDLDIERSMHMAAKSRSSAVGITFFWSRLSLALTPLYSVRGLPTKGFGEAGFTLAAL